MRFYPVPTVAPEVCERNAAHTRTLGLAGVERAGRVAVVGGGSPLADHLDTLKTWDGPIWAVNQTFTWLKGRGIKSCFFTTDPKPQPWITVERGDQALVADHCAPELFETLSPAYVRTFTLAEDEVQCGVTTATAGPHLAVWMGHRSVTFFGCDSSFDESGGYAFEHGLPRDLIEVRCNGEVYLTKPEFMWQAQALAELCRELPHYCQNQSGGLLAAMIADPEHDVLGYARAA